MLTRIWAASICSPALACASAFTAPCADVNNPAHSASSACQLPRPRSCCCGMAPSSAATRCGARCAAASAIIEATGLRLCGIADEPPRPASDGSLNSPISPCAISARSAANLPRLPHRMPICVPSVTHSSRCVCHAPAGTRNPSSPATRASTAGPCWPSTDNVPTAPPSCNCNAFWAAACRRARARTSGALQPTSFKPRLMTCAGCSRVRARTGTAPWLAYQPNRLSTSICRSRSIRASARRVASTIAVSITSWLVLPQCT